MAKRTYTTAPRRFTRPWWIQNAKNLLWVTFITLLIFAYADIEFTDEMEFRATIILTTGSAEGLTLLSQPSHEMSFRLSGSQTKLLEFANRLQRNRSVMIYNLAQQYGPGQYNLRAMEIVDAAAAKLLNRESLEEAGLSVLSVSPEAIPNLRIDRQITVPDVEVDFRATGGELASDPVFTPPRIAVQVAESRWDAIQSAQPPDTPVRVQTQPVDLSVAGDGPIEVDLVPSINGIPVKPLPPQVKVEYEIRSRARTKTFNVTVRMLCPYSWADDGTWVEFDLEAKDDFWWQKELIVSGPQSDLERLSVRDIDAYFELNENHKTPIESYHFLPVKVRFPPEMDVQLAGPPPTVQIRMVRRPAVP